MKRLAVIVCLCLLWVGVYPVAAQELSKITILDHAGNTVGAVSNTPEIQQAIQNLLENPGQLSAKARIEFQGNEKVYRIPLEPPVKLHGGIITEVMAAAISQNDTVFVYFDEQNAPQILRFNYKPAVMTQLEAAN